MNRLKSKHDISIKVHNMKVIMDSLFTENENKSLSLILCDFKSNRSIQYLVDNVQPYIDTKVKLMFLRCLGEIIPPTHRDRFYNYCISKGLPINKRASDVFDTKRLTTAYNRAPNWNPFLNDYDQEDNELTDIFDMKSTCSSKEDEISVKRKNSSYRSFKAVFNPIELVTDAFNSHHLFICRLGRLNSQHCDSHASCLQTWGINWWRSRSTYAVYVIQVDEVTLYRRNDMLEHDIRIGQNLKLINNKEISKIDDEEFLDILENSLFIDLVLQGKGISIENLWEAAGSDHKWIDCISDRNCQAPLYYTVSMDTTLLKPMEFINDASHELGINIRGGKEYSLGIYISSVRNGSVGAIMGLQPGDKLLQINSIGLNGSNTPSRNDAMNMIYQNQNSDLWVYSLNKLPLTVSLPESRNRRTSSAGKKSEPYSVLESKGMFHRGQRNQLTHTSLTQPASESLESQISGFASKQDVNKTESKGFIY